MAFADLIADLDALTLSTFGLPVTLHYADRVTPSVDVTAIVKNPVFEEDYVPGSVGPDQGVSVLSLFIRFSDLTAPVRRGDGATFNGVDYDIGQVSVDREGGATLRLRRRGGPYA